MDTIELDFKGYKLEDDWSSLEDLSAVYCIYACIYNAERRTVDIRKLLYIGESKSLKSRVTDEDHEGIERAHRKLKYDEELCLSYAEVDGRSRKRIENALIFEHQPICCIDDKDSYTHETVKIKTFGKNRFLSEEFIVEQGSEVD